MKTKFIIMLFLSSVLVSNELEWVDEQIEAIKPPRKGVEIVGVQDPFIFLEKNKPIAKKDSVASLAAPQLSAKPFSEKLKDDKADENGSKRGFFELSAIINTSAMIDGNWYKKSDKIKEYTVVDINKTTVTLKKGKKELVLSTYNKKSTLKFKNK